MFLVGAVVRLGECPYSTSSVFVVVEVVVVVPGWWASLWAHMWAGCKS